MQANVVMRRGMRGQMRPAAREALCRQACASPRGMFCGAMRGRLCVRLCGALCESLRSALRGAVPETLRAAFCDSSCGRIRRAFCRALRSSTCISTCTAIRLSMWTPGRPTPSLHQAGPGRRETGTILPSGLLPKPGVLPRLRPGELAAAIGLAVQAEVARQLDAAPVPVLLLPVLLKELKPAP